MLSPRTARTNRLLLASLGLLLLATGAFGLGETQSVWFARSAHQPLLTASETSWVHGHNWAWWLAVLLAAVVTLACLRWLLIQARTATVHAFDLEPDPTQGYTRVAGSAVVRAVEEELDTYPEVRRAHAEMVATGGTQLRLSVSTHDGASLAALRQRIQSELLPHIALHLNLIVA
jgi:hypothetical protein